MHRLILLIVVLSAMTALPGAAQVITVGIDNNQPLTFFNSDGQADGLFPALLNEIAAKSDWTLNYTPCHWQQCLDMLESERINLLPAIAYTPQRARRFQFAQETVVHSWGQVYHREDRRFDSILQLDGARIAVLADDVYFQGEQGLEQVAERFGMKLVFQPVTSYKAAFEAVAAGRADAAMVGRIYGQRHYQEYRLQASSIMIKPIEVRPAFSAGTPKDSVVAFDRLLAAWKNDSGSSYYRALDAWLKTEQTIGHPPWLRPLMYALSTILVLLLFITWWTRRQVKSKTRQLEEHNRFLQSLIDGVSDPLLVIGLDHSVLQMNQAARELRADATNPGAGSWSCHKLSHTRPTPCDGSDYPCPLQEVTKTGQTVNVIHQHETARGRRIVELTASPLYNTAGKLYAIIEVSRDITERLQIEELLNENEKRLHHLAHHDHLTDLPNRLLFADRLQQAISKARRSHRQIALLFLDLDEFKTINDTLGHDHGDLLLIDIARRLRQSVRESDTVARMGGDEFLILLEDIESLEMIETMAERISRALTHTLRKDDFTHSISASIGISIFPEDANNSQDLLKKADLAMYQAKNAGRARYHFYNPPQGRFLFA